LPLTNRPYIKPESGSDLQLGIAINTDQNARTFQDRSHVFSISPRPSQVGDKKIYNVNTRGRRGNIVQAYPAVEYDFVPQELTVEQGDYLHIQWSGSDFNAPKNPNNAEGWEYSDRHNMVQIRDLNTQFPIPFDKQNFFQSTAQAHRFAWVDTDTTLQSLVDPQTGNNYECRQIPASKPPAQTNTESAQVQNDPLNCGKLNWAPARFDGGLMYVQQKPGNYYFTSTRDNNFSNRSPKWNLKINPGQLKSQNHSLVAVAIGISITILVFGLGGLAVVYYLRKARRRDNDHTDRSEYNALKQPVGKSNTRRPDRV